jgi:hypothetical protein
MHDVLPQDLDGLAACRGIPCQAEREASERLELRIKAAEGTAHRGHGKRAQTAKRPCGLVAGVERGVCQRPSKVPGAPVILDSAKRSGYSPAHIEVRVVAQRVAECGHGPSYPGDMRQAAEGAAR